MNRKLFSAVSAAIGAAMLFASCGGGAGAADNAPAGSVATAPGAATEAGPRGSLNWAIMQVPVSWDVEGWTSAHQLPLFTAVFDTLLRVDGEGNAIPGLATDWSWDDSRTVLTMTIRDGVTFTDGTAVDAEAVAANLNRFRDSSGPNSGWASTVVGATASGNQVVLEYTQPNPDAFAHLSESFGLISSPASWNNADVASNPVGSGPYILDTAATVVGSTYVVRANPNYWDDSFGRFETVTFISLPDGTALSNAILGGQIDFTGLWGIDMALLPQFEAQGLDVLRTNLNWQGLTLFNRGGEISPAFADVRVRQAVNYCIDGVGMRDAHFAGEGIPTSQIFGPASSGYLPELDDRFPFDPDRGRELIAEAGYAGQEILITIPASPAANRAAIASYAQMLSECGFTVVPVDVEASTQFAQIAAGEFTAMVVPLNTTSSWRQITYTINPDAQFNPFPVDDPYVAELVSIIQSGSDAEATAAAQDLNRHVTELAWFAPWFFANVHSVANPNVVNVTTHLRNVLPAMYMVTPR